MPLARSLKKIRISFTSTYTNLGVELSRDWSARVSNLAEVIIFYSWGRHLDQKYLSQSRNAKFENEGFTLKTHQTFFTHTAPKELSRNNFGFVLEENSGREIT